MTICFKELHESSFFNMKTTHWLSNSRTKQESKLHNTTDFYDAYGENSIYANILEVEPNEHKVTVEEVKPIANQFEEVKHVQYLEEKTMQEPENKKCSEIITFAKREATTHYGKRDAKVEIKQEPEFDCHDELCDQKIMDTQEFCFQKCISIKNEPDDGEEIENSGGTSIKLEYGNFSNSPEDTNTTEANNDKRIEQILIPIKTEPGDCEFSNTIRRQTKERDVKCAYCSKEFTHSASLQEHILEHKWSTEKHNLKKDLDVEGSMKNGLCKTEGILFFFYYVAYSNFD